VALAIALKNLQIYLLLGYVSLVVLLNFIFLFFIFPFWLIKAGVKDGFLKSCYFLSLII